MGKRRIGKALLALALLCTLGYAGAKGKYKDTEDFDWVVIVKDEQTMKEMNGMRFILDLRAVNTTGDINGPYSGSATLKMLLGKDGVDFNGLIKNEVHFLLSSPVATLDKKKFQTYFTGDGKMYMAGGANVRVTSDTGEVYEGSKSGAGVREVHVVVDGTQVEFTVTMTPNPPLTFHGYMIGEGKKPPKKGTPKKIKDEDALAPLTPAEPLAPLVPEEPLTPLVPTGK